MIKCDVCGKGVEKGPMHRVNPLGEKGVFRHEPCGGVAADDATKELVDLIDADRSALTSTETK
jgi:hypothetical protein